PEARLVIRTMLDALGCEVLEASNGVEVLAQLRAAHPSPELLILDLMMPTMDGFEVLRLLRAEDLWRTLPVIIVTAKDLDRQEHEWLRMQAQGCIQKSQISPQEFLDYVRQLTPQTD